MSDSIPHVVFAGGGYVTINAVHKLRRHIRAGRVRCTVIDKNNFHTFHGLVGEMVAAKIQPSQIISPARRLFAPAAFHNALIESIDTDKKMVSTRRALDGRRYDLSYDFLVVSIGTIDNLSRYPGISEHAFKLKDYWACFQLRNQIIRMLELAEIEDDPEERQRRRGATAGRRRLKAGSRLKHSSPRPRRRARPAEVRPRLGRRGRGRGRETAWRVVLESARGGRCATVGVGAAGTRTRAYQL